MPVSITCARFDTTFIVSMPHKYWGISSLTYIIEHIDYVLYEPNLLASLLASTGRSSVRPHKTCDVGSLDMHRTQIFADPPQGWSNQGGGAVAHPSTSRR
jgi:hypothetical protein